MKILQKQRALLLNLVLFCSFCPTTAVYAESISVKSSMAVLALTMVVGLWSFQYKDEKDSFGSKVFVGLLGASGPLLLQTLVVPAAQTVGTKLLYKDQNNNLQDEKLMEFYRGHNPQHPIYVDYTERHNTFGYQISIYRQGKLVSNTKPIFNTPSSPQEESTLPAF